VPRSSIRAENARSDTRAASGFSSTQSCWPCVCPAGPALCHWFLNAFVSSFQNIHRYDRVSASTKSPCLATTHRIDARTVSCVSASLSPAPGPTPWWCRRQQIDRASLLICASKFRSRESSPSGLRAPSSWLQNCCRDRRIRRQSS